MPRGGPINYREEEKKILDSSLGKDVYDNRIRPSGLNGTGEKIELFIRTTTIHYFPCIGECLRARKLPPPLILWVA